MRGFPLLRLVFVVVVLGVLAIPVWRVTRAKSDAGEPPRAEAAGTEKNATFVAALTASAPATLRVMAANQPTALSEVGVKFFEARFVMAADRPEDLAVFAEFDDKSSAHAVRVEVRAGGKAIADTTLWGTGLVEDVVEIPAP
jgi:uncharacterized protein with GYD domain